MDDSYNMMLSKKQDPKEYIYNDSIFYRFKIKQIKMMKMKM